MILNTDQTPDSIVSLRGTNLKIVAMFKYLGVYIDSKQPSTGDGEVNLPVSNSLNCLTF